MHVIDKEIKTFRQARIEPAAISVKHASMLV